MGTRGYIVVKIDKKYYTVYNHCDSYPENLGSKIINKIKNSIVVKTVDFAVKFLSSLSTYKFFIEKTEPECDIQIEWVYIIDLNEMTIKIKGGFYKPIYKITDFDDDTFYNNWLDNFLFKNDELYIEYKKNE